MNKTKLLLLVFFSLSNLNAVKLSYFNSRFEKNLKKDEQLFIIVKGGMYEKLLTFRWTLFHNNGLVTLMNFNGQPSQNLLYKRYRENSIKVEIISKYNKLSVYHPYLIINFLGYNYMTKSAKFEILHKDLSKKTSIKEGF